jgi:hypothetical protein
MMLIILIKAVAERGQLDQEMPVGKALSHTVAEWCKAAT